MFKIPGCIPSTANTEGKEVGLTRWLTVLDTKPEDLSLIPELHSGS